MLISKKKAKPANAKSGQSLVELAVSLPVLILLLLGTVDFGMAIFSYSILRDAAQEGAFYGSFNPTNRSEIEIRTRNISPRGAEDVFSSPINLRDASQIKVTIKTIGAACQGFTNGAANSIEVGVVYKYPILMPFVGPLTGQKTILLTGKATNVILQPACP